MEMTNFNNSELVELNYNEMLSVDGGYSWAEFKADCASAWSDFKSGLSSGYDAGHAAALK
jgi:hypothetical protein